MSQNANHRRVNQPSIVVRGRVITGPELREYAERNGLCPRCGVYQTHKKSGSFLKPRFEPLTLTNAQNEITVYKGYCIAPTCFTLEAAKQLLGEIPFKRPSNASAISDAGFARASVLGRQQFYGQGGSGGVFESTLHIGPMGSRQPSDSSIPARQAEKSEHSSGSSQPKQPIILTSTAAAPANLSDGSDHRRHVRQHSWGSSVGRNEQRFTHRRTPTDESFTASAKLTPQPTFGREDFFNNNDSGHNRTSGFGISRPSLPNLRDSNPNLQATFERAVAALHYDSGDSGPRSSTPIPSPLTMSPLRVGSDRSPTTYLDNNHNNVLALDVTKDPLVAKLEEKIQESNYLEFMNLLDNQQRKTDIVMEGFRLLRYHVVLDHLRKPDGVVLVGDNWVKVLKEKVQEYSERGEREVVISGIATFLTLSRQGDTYKRSLIRKGAVDLTMKIWDEWPHDEAILESSCALVLSLVLHERISLNSKTFPGIAILIRKLANVIHSDISGGKGSALRALYHISNQRKKAETTGKTALFDVRNALGNEVSVRAILDVIQPEHVTPPVVEAGLALLWKICLPREDDNSIVLGGSLENAHSAVSILDRAKTPEVMEAVCGLLANFALIQAFPPDMAHRAATRICNLLDDPEFRTREVANVAIHTLCNLYANDFAKPGMVTVGALLPTTISLLEEFPDDEDVVEYVCLTVSRAAREDSEKKQFLAGPTMFRLVRTAFETFVLDRGSKPSYAIKDSTLCFFASISGCEIGAHTLVESGLQGELQQMLAIEMDADFRQILEVITRNINKFMGPNSGTTTGNSGSVLRQQPSLFLQLLRNAVSEDDVSALIQELGELGEAGLSVLGNHGFDEMLSILSRYEYSSSVQKEGSYFLATLYYTIPLSVVETPIQLPGGAWAMLHKRQAVELLCDAIGSHPEDVETQIAGLTALTNLLSPLCAVDRSSPNIMQVQTWLMPVWKRTMQTLQTNTYDCTLQEAGLYLCWILTYISSEKELRNWMLSLLQHIFDTMSRFKSVEELNLIACDVLLRLLHNPECTAFMGNSTCIESLVPFFDGDSSELALRASAILSALATQTLVAIDQIMQLPDVPSRLIACVESHPAEHYIATHICIILEALMNFEDITFRYELLEYGALHAFSSALGLHQANATMCRHACLVLTLVVPYVTGNLLGSLRSLVKSTFLPLLQVHLDHPETEAAVLDLLWAVGGMDEQQKWILLSDQNLQLIIQAMACHLESVELQRAGCGMLWFLSGFGDGKRMIGQAGGIPVILNAMLAHNESTSIQKEALTALKNLATEAFNKPLLAQLDCVRVVTYSLWINYRHPVVLSSALSALNNIAVDSQTKSVAPLPTEVLDIVLSAMRRFPNDEILQKNACFYLKSCTYRADNRYLMNQRAAELIFVLQQASNKFPQSCQERARSIMKKIER